MDEFTGIPPIGVGDGSVITGAIIDKNCRIGRNVRLEVTAGQSDTDIDDTCAIRDGIPVLIKNATVPDGWSLRA